MKGLHHPWVSPKIRKNVLGNLTRLHSFSHTRPTTAYIYAIYSHVVILTTGLYTFVCMFDKLHFRENIE